MPRHLLLYGPPPCGQIHRHPPRPRACPPSGRRLPDPAAVEGGGPGGVPANPGQLPRRGGRPLGGSGRRVFLTLGPGEGEKRLYPDVLLNETLPLLEAGAPFYIIDECGGRELMLRPFREALARRLTGPAP